MSNDTHKLSDVIELYCDKKKREAWSTRQWRRRAWRHLIDAVGDIEIADLCYNDIEDFEAHLFDNNQNANGVRSYLKAVSRVVGWSERRGLRQGNPFDGYRYPRRVDSDIHVFSDSEVSAMFTAAPCLRWQAMVSVAVSAGLRKSESLNLRIEDVDFDRRVISIQPHRGTASTWPWTPKSYQRRQVPLTDQASRLLCAIMADEIPPGQPYLLLDEDRFWHLKKMLAKGTLSDRLRLSPDENFNPAFSRIRRDAELNTGTYHDLRRTCLTVWSRHIPPQELHKLAGHASIETTMRYYLGVRADVLATLHKLSIGATGLEPATS